jgi:hypothetical protein
MSFGLRVGERMYVSNRGPEIGAGGKPGIANRTIGASSSGSPAQAHTGRIRPCAQL